jgi:hypothetical protein
VMLPELRAIRRLSPSVLIELCRLWCILLYVDARLGLLPARWNCGFLFRQENGTVASPHPETLARIAKIAALLRLAARFRLRAGSPCLCLTLSLRSRLASFGLRSTAVYGARRSSDDSSGDIDAHAWLSIGTAKIDLIGDSLLFQKFTRQGLPKTPETFLFCLHRWAHASEMGIIEYSGPKLPPGRA